VADEKLGVHMMKKRLTIGVMIGNANSPHAKILMKGICEVAKKMDVNVIFFLGVHMTSYFREYLGEGTDKRYDYQYNIVYDYALLSDVDGIIISYGSLSIFLEDNDPSHFLDRFRDIPYVILEERDKRKVGTSIISDNYTGMYQVVEHLVLQHGCKKLLFVSGPDGNTDAQEREKAFRDVLGKYNIALSDRMIARGDYSQSCSRQISELLDNNPDADAVVCANDIMAETTYQECAKRDLVVGKDIAVTGYDDWEMAESMLPSLTTVLQNEWDMAKESMQQIVALCNGGTPVELRSPAEMKVRASCGCASTSEYHFKQIHKEMGQSDEDYVLEISAAFCDNILRSQVSTAVMQSVLEQVGAILECCMEMYKASVITDKSKKALMDRVNDLCYGKSASYISATAMTDGINEYVRYLINKETVPKKIRLINEISGMINQYIQSCVITRNNAREDRTEQDTMFVPLISRDMITNIDNEMEFYKAPMYILSVLRVKSAYLYMLDYPRTHEYGQEWDCPGYLSLVSSLEDGKCMAYEKDIRPIISQKEGIFDNIKDERRRMLAVLNLFLGQEQYGILVVETQPEDMLLMHLVSLQISSALNFFYLYQQQTRMQKRLEVLIDEVNEKNKILGFISAYDELTGILNRRGFMEKAMQLIHATEKKDAILFIADLDHLKEINDSFGHVSGDFALRESARILQETLGKEGQVARIGGDEFVAILPYDYRMDGEDYIRSIKEACDELNSTSDKEFYVEMSVGYTVFRCDSSVDFNYLLSNSDKMLYEAKRLRRKSIIKEDK